MNKQILFKLLVTRCILCFTATTPIQTAAKPQKPNILWLPGIFRVGAH